MSSDMLATVLDDTVAHLQTYVVFPEPHQANAIALWLAYTHALPPSQKIRPVFDVAPYVLVTSPERQSGKSTLKDVMLHIAARGKSTDGITPAALIRILDSRPTMFIDEIDTIFKSERGEGGQDNETIRAILNSGFNVTGKFDKVVMAKDAVISYPTFGPKALFGIGQVVPETVTSRSIRIRLQRKERGAGSSQRARIRRVTAEGAVLRERLREVMASTSLTEVDESEFDARLSDRAVDIWEPLYAVADAAGGAWPDRVRAAAIALSTGESEEDDHSVGEMLLKDIRDVFDDLGSGSLLLTDIIGVPEDTNDKWGHSATGLCAIEDGPWATYRGGRLPITPRRVAQVLKGYGIRAKRLRVGGKQGSAYERADFEKPWKLYLKEPEPKPAPAPALRVVGGDDDDWPLPF